MLTMFSNQNYLGSGTIKDDADSKNYANVNIDGITPEYLEYMKLEMHAGRNLTKADNHQCSRYYYGRTGKRLSCSLDGL